MTLKTVSIVDLGDREARGLQLHKLMVGWRLRLHPRELPGLVSTKAHVSQEEAAFLCGLTHSYFGALERGKVDRGYSDATLDTVARVLRLSACERIALYLLATGREPKPRPPATPTITPAVCAELDCRPWPAYIVDATWDMLACNAATWAWFPHLGREKNIMRALFCLPEIRVQLLDWETVHMPHAIALLRAQLTRLPQHERLRLLVREILNRCPPARTKWAHDPRVWMHEDGDRRQLYLPGATEPTQVEVVSFTPMRSPDLRVTSWIPTGGHIPVECRTSPADRRSA